MLRNEKGLTLIEVMAAMTILAVIVIAFMNLSQYNLLSGRQSDHRQIAQTIAEQVLNEKRAYIAGTPQTDTYLTSATQVTLNDTRYADYTVYAQTKKFSGTSPAPSPGTLPISIPASLAGYKHVSTQGIVLLKNSTVSGQLDPYLLTVAVFWRD